MAYIRKNVNTILMLLVIALVILFVVFTYYSREKFKSLSQEYYDKKANIEILLGN
ncbi:hypothetical protein HYS48_00460 [Candidatus Woesearchaeota archaeon]|nr:hypothetical protein [Candidatus Woesearchaeota archaeon]